MKTFDLFFSKQGRRLRDLYPDQQEAIDKLDAAIAEGHSRIMLQAGCGFGKTLTSAHLISRFLDQNKTVCFCVPRLPLIDQAVAEFAREGLEFGVIQGDHYLTDHSQQLQIASLQTLERRRNSRRFDVVFYDEAHIVHKVMLRMMRNNPDTLFIGLSATPWAKRLGKLYTRLIIAGTIKDLIARKRLCEYVVYAPSPEPDLSGVKTVRGDFDQEALSAACNTSKLVGDVVETWQKFGQNQQTLCFGVNRAHSKHLCERFIEAGIAAAYIDCFTQPADRREIIDRFHRGEIKIICNTGVLTTGFDSDVRTLIDCHPTRSDSLYVQTIGRALRLAPGKEKAIILDHAGNALRLGLPCEIGLDRLTLDTGEKISPAAKAREKKEPKPRLCQQCKAIVPPMTEACQHCGYVRPAVTEVIARDGELVLFGSEARARHEASMADKIAFYGELRWIARESGHKDGWAYYKFRDRYGQGPESPAIKYAKPRPPTLKTINWVKAQKIAWIKSRQRANG